MKLLHALFASIKVFRYKRFKWIDKFETEDIEGIEEKISENKVSFLLKLDSFISIEIEVEILLKLQSSISHYKLQSSTHLHRRVYWIQQYTAVHY